MAKRSSKIPDFETALAELEALVEKMEQGDLSLDESLQQFERGVQLTDLRRAVLSIIWQSHSAIGAYDILDRLREMGRRAAPVTVYRALDFLIANGLVHRLTSQNAYLGCDHPDQSHDAQILICRLCGAAGEVSAPAITAAIEKTAAASGFRIEAPVVEITGICPRCAEPKGPAR